MNDTEFKGVKIRCENWNRKIQMLLGEVLGCKWANGLPTPWNTRRSLLVVQKGTLSGNWFLMWATSADFAECLLPEWSAKTLYKSYIRPVETSAK